MRCNECNIDIGEEYTKCTLCGAKASDEKPHLEGIKTAEYPKYNNEIVKKKKGCNYPQKFVLRISFAVCAALGVSALVLSHSFWSVGVPCLILINTVFYFICGLVEKKGKLLHSLVALIATLAFSLLTLIVSAATKCGLLWSSRAFALCAVAVIILCVIRKKRAVPQLKALFNL